ncbi:SusC/RagA family TonB-linked outer membrane protein [Flavobacterium sp. Root420]|uniref:SusC/RagA family TonB-linked outer membrane protein n=1 Tax=Flavobacterium sp. Root420 TaxID=1736533 RepID=UPI0007003CF8|nr:SusC/RagA family TonB-linked outer membrane protein [Flavobacterium sp. Root420]KQX14379.1 SusC/RagA family TonB-linked outer membrane protein [Flavobacterium sp. Root420]
MKPTTQAFKSTATSCYRDKMFYTILFLFVVFSAFSQQKISGKITDSNNIPIPGVSVLEKSTTNAVASDFDGNFEITIKGNDPILVFSYLGFKTKEIKSGGKKVLNIVLEPEVNELTEVVLIGYGSQKKGDVTSAIASVKSTDFVQGNVRDAAQLIQGKVAGLTVSAPSGDPTEGSQIQLRGFSSLSGTSQPLILVDGVPGSLTTVAPEDIASIDVLKDGSATAIYGTRGTNGVVIITTKSGSFNAKPTIEYNGYTTVSTISNKMNFLDAGQLREKMAEGYKFIGANSQDFGSNTDWLDEITRTALSQTHNVLFRGGSDVTNISASINYKGGDGIFLKSDNKKMTGRVDVNHSMFDKKLKTNIGYIASEQVYNALGDGTSFDPYIYRQALIRNPTEPIRDDEGKWNERDVYFYDNPVGYIEETIGENRFRNTRFDFSMSYDFNEFFKLKGVYTRKGNSIMKGFYQTKNHVSTVKYAQDGFASRSAEDYRGNYGEFTLDYKQSFGKHNLTALAGYNYEDNITERFWATNRRFPTDAFLYNNIGSGQGLQLGEAGMGSDKFSNTLIAFFARMTYNFDNKYLFMASIRHEGSSRFGEDNKWGNFPGVSAGWRINNEDFLKNTKWINNLKLRAGFGITGINAGENYQSLSGLTYGNYFLNDGKWIRELVPTRNANPDLKWEKKEEINLGLDFGFFDDRISGAIDYYSRTTKDALMDYSVPTPPYFYGTIAANAAEIKNSGLELLLNVTPIKTDNLIWTVNLTYSTNTNKMVSLSNDKFQLTNNFFDTGYTGEPIQISTHRIQEGQPIGNFFGLKSVDITDDGIWIIETPDGRRIPATEATTEDRQILGNGLPRSYYSINNAVRYKNWDMNVNLRGAMDYQILNFSRMFYENPTIAYNTLDSAYDKVYDKAVLNDVQRYVSYYVEDGDFLKIDNITIGFTLPKSTFKFIDTLRIYASGSNLATFTSYKGIDPEVNRDGLFPGNDDRDKYPSTRSFSIGLNITL